MRYELTEREWTAIEPMLPNKPRGVARLNDRRVLNGIFWVLRSGAPWRDLPGTFGSYTTCYNRFVRWKKRQDDGGFRRLDLSANIITMHWLQLVTRWRTLWSFVRRSGAMPFPRCNVCTVGREHGDGGRIKRQTLPTLHR